ncbi:MAG: hypothetical protein QW320_04915 [Ignisphaera sp.]
MTATSRTRSKHVDVYQNDIKRGEHLATDVMRLLSSFGLTDIEVYVSGVERIEDYDAVYMTLNVVVPEFTGTMLEDIKNIIHEYGFVVHSDFKVIPSGDKVHVTFYLTR